MTEPRPRFSSRVRWTLRSLVVVGLLALIVPSLITCRNMESAPPVPAVTEGELAGLRLVEAFPSLPAFERPVYLGAVPGPGERLFVLEQHGVVTVFENRPDVDRGQVFLDISGRVSREGNEEGLLGLAFHPEFATNGTFYAYYSSTEGGPALGGRSLLSAFRVGADGLGDAASEVVLLEVEQPWRNHNGGALEFGPDGMLYLGLGDGGLRGDFGNHGQDLETLLGSILRIDVDARTGELAYGIPPDNPFLDDEDARPEIWAYGLRNPWRFSFDRGTGRLWTGDVGQDEWEEVDLIERGGNYGWSIYEGHEEFDSFGSAEDAIFPVAVYPRSEGKSITGGYVYRGPGVAGLRGHYLYADYVTGAVWALPLDDTGRPTGADPVKVIAGGGPIASFGEDHHGEVYVVAHGGRMYRFARAEAPPLEPLPAKLSETGLFASLPALEPVAGAVPYQVAVALWSDGAAKDRFLVLPDGGQLRVTEADAWEVPVGTCAVKTFTQAGQRLETRVIRRDPEGWTTGTYVWDEDCQDARLLAEPETRALAGGGSWYFPAGADCQACHSQAAGFLLGVSSAQLNHPGSDGQEQLERWRAGGLLSAASSPRELPRFPSLDDEQVPVATRARAYLAVNCASCHMPGAPGNAAFDLRHSVPLDEANLVDVAPSQGDLGLGAEARLLAPGDPERSLLLLRMRLRGDPRAMPPLASLVPDPQGLALVEAWIRELAR
jgi:uncharacterized repeat protein (TIGR03806 family)